MRRLSLIIVLTSLSLCFGVSSGASLSAPDQRSVARPPMSPTQQILQAQQSVQRDEAALARMQLMTGDLQTAKQIRRATALPKPQQTATAPPSNSSAPPTCDGRIATIVGTSGNDVLKGTPGRDVVVGLGGDDTIYGYGQDDVICGGPGDDVIWAGAGMIVRSAATVTT
jgi:hemolysin type calcium-binding protein